MGFLISASIVFIVSFLLVTFPEAVGRETIIKYHEKKRARRDAHKTFSSSDSNSDLRNEIELNDITNKANVLNKRRLETIEETGEMANNKDTDMDDKASSNTSPIALSTFTSNSFDSLSTATTSNASLFNQSSAAFFTIKTEGNNAEVIKPNEIATRPNTIKSRINNILLKIKGKVLKITKRFMLIY